MRRLRFNIANLLGVILVLGVGFAALRESATSGRAGFYPDAWQPCWSRSCSPSTAQSPGGHSGSGFALFGWIYLGLSLVPSIESRLITTKALAYLDSKVLGRSLELSPLGSRGRVLLRPAIKPRISP